MADAPPLSSVMVTDVVTLIADQRIEDAVSSLLERGISGAPVVDGNGRLVGLLDDSDLILTGARLHAPTAIEILGAYLPFPGERQRYDDEVRHALGRTVGEVMHTDVATVGPDATVEDVATLMVDGDISRVPVVDEERRVVGIVARGDVVKALYRSRPE